MSRPATDLGHLSVCLAGPCLFFGGAVALEIWHRGVDPWCWSYLPAGLFVGWSVYDGLARSARRVTRRRDDQGEDYEDRG